MHGARAQYNSRDVFHIYACRVFVILIYVWQMYVYVIINIISTIGVCFLFSFCLFCCVCVCMYTCVGRSIFMYCELCGAYAHVYAGAYIHECVQARGGCQQPVLSFSTYYPETGSLTETRARLKTNTNPPVCDLTTPSSLHGFGSLNSGPQAA